MLLFQTAAKLQQPRCYRWIKMGETEKNADETAWRDSEISGRIIFIRLRMNMRCREKARVNGDFLSFLCFVFVFLRNCIGFITDTYP